MRVELTHQTNYGNGRGGPGENRGRSYVILHGTGIRPGVEAEKEITFLQRASVGVSYHYYVTKAGVVVQLVPEEARAWHAGSSRWQADTDLNDLSIGVAFESSNGFDEVYPATQLNAGQTLVGGILDRYGISVSNVLTHKDVSSPPGRKIDPVNWPGTSFLEMLKGTRTRQRRLPLYSEDNRLLGEVTIVEERKAYLGNAVVAQLCAQDS